MEAGSGSPGQQKRISVPLVLIATGLLFAVMTVTKLTTQRPFVDIDSPRPLWTASITGTNGDIAEIWVWTPTATLRTNLPVPVELRLRDRNFLLQVRSTQNRDMALDVVGKQSGNGHGRLAAGGSNSVSFTSVARIPFFPVDCYTGVSPPSLPLGIRPVFDKFPYLILSTFDIVTNAVTSP